jgi:hypothetical protein
MQNFMVAVRVAVAGALLAVAFADPAYSYIDPGSASLWLQGDLGDMAASKGLPPSLHEEVEVRCELRLQKIMKRSFRDPLASVFVTQDSVLRGASERLSETLTRLVSSSFYRENAGSRLINTQFISKDEAETELGSDALNDNEFSIWMRHERIPLVTYSSEWCFSYLKSAAMLHIDV